MFERFLDYIKQHNLLSAADRILVAVSGGPDSVALTHLLLQAGFDIALAHVNFQLRGKDSDLDQDFVQKLAASYGLKLFVKCVDTRSYAQKNKLSIEMAARELRYTWFEQLAARHGFSKIATAHTADDNVETILLNLMRGTGIRGLIGIPPRAGKIVRPLLFAYKSEILQYCSENNLPYRIDKTNFETDFVRNKIRHLIIPQFESINPAFKQNVLRTAGNLQQAYGVVQQYLSQIRPKIVSSTWFGIKIDIQRLLAEEHSKLILFEILREYNFSPAQIEQIYQSLHRQPGTVFIATPYRAVVDRGYLLIGREQKRENLNIEILTPENQQIKVLDYILDIKTTTINQIQLKVPHDIGQFDLEQLSFPLKVRFWKTGDWFIPLGMQGRRKLSDFLKDLKLNYFEKQRVLVLTDRFDRIIWVIGYRIDQRFRITPNTKKVLQIKLLHK